MGNWVKLFTSLNVFVFRLSNGRLGSKLGKQMILLLHTVGRKSGKDHFTTRSYYRDGENYLVVASNWGKESNPDWYLNLMQHPHSTIQIGPNIIPVEARKTEGDEYKRLWKLVTSKNEQYISYQKGMERHLPIVVLNPSS